MHEQGWHRYYVYILTNKNKTVLYTGMTNNLQRRLEQHSSSIVKPESKSFTARYDCRHLLYYEEFTWIQEAIAREKEIKGWLRSKKLDLIKSNNPSMEFLERDFLY